MKQEIVNHLTWLVNDMAHASTSDRKSGRWEIFYNSLKKHLDVTKLTAAEARELRFMRWDDGSDLYLFPLWLVPMIPEGTVVTSISGEEFHFHKAIADLDTRFGCVSFGLMIPENTDTEDKSYHPKITISGVVADALNETTMFLLEVADIAGVNRNQLLIDAAVSWLAAAVTKDHTHTQIPHTDGGTE